MAKVKFEAVATIGKYKDKSTGEERKQYLRVGTVFENKDGSLSLKLDAVPCSPDWSGFISFYEPRGRDDEPSGQQRARNVPGPSTGHQNGAPPPQHSPQHQEDDDIPF